jgi:hypothetical protein
MNVGLSIFAPILAALASSLLLLLYLLLFNKISQVLPLKFVFRLQRNHCTKSAIEAGLVMHHAELRSYVVAKPLVVDFTSKIAEDHCNTAVITDCN